MPMAEYQLPLRRCLASLGINCHNRHPIPKVQSPRVRERLTRGDWIFLAICAAISAVSVYVALRWFASAFPEASIDFRYDRRGSTVIAERVARAEGVDTSGFKHTAVFDDDDGAKVFLERTL